MTARAIRYAGVRKDKTPVTGKATTADLPGWVEKHYRMGWRRLSVTADGTTHVVGWIGPRTEGGGRTWWAEQS